MARLISQVPALTRVGDILKDLGDADASGSLLKMVSGLIEGHKERADQGSDEVIKHLKDNPAVAAKVGVDLLLFLTDLLPDAVKGELAGPEGLKPLVGLRDSVDRSALGAKDYDLVAGKSFEVPKAKKEEHGTTGTGQGATADADGRSRARAPSGVPRRARGERGTGALESSANAHEKRVEAGERAGGLGVGHLPPSADPKPVREQLPLFG